MPKVTLSTANKVASNDSIPTLKLGYGEYALIVLFEPEPEQEFVHTLRAPAIGPDGRVIKEEREKKDGSTYTTPKMEFFGSHLCFGDFDTVSDKGVDPANCPTCKAAQEGNGVEAPKARFALNVIKYGLQNPSTGWALRDPFTVECIPWAFAQGRFNTLIDYAEEWEDLRKHDLKLGKCENKDFQKYDMAVAAKAEWMKDKARAELVKATYERNRVEDLTTVIGRRVGKDKALEDLARVAERLQQAYNSDGAVAVSASATVTEAIESATGVATESVASLSDVPAPAATGTVTEINFDDLMSGL